MAGALFVSAGGGEDVREEQAIKKGQRRNAGVD